MTPQPTGRRSGSHRAALTQKITAQVGPERAEEIITQKRQKTRTGVFIAALSMLVALLVSYEGKAPWWAGPAVALLGGLLGAQIWSGEYVSAAVKDLGGSLADVFSKFRRPGGAA